MGDRGTPGCYDDGKALPRRGGQRGCSFQPAPSIARRPNGGESEDWKREDFFLTDSERTSGEDERPDSWPHLAIKPNCVLRGSGVDFCLKSLRKSVPLYFCLTYIQFFDHPV